MTPIIPQQQIYQIDRMVNSFSRVMKMKLHENVHKGSWEKCTFDYLRSRIDDEIKEFDKAIEEGRYSDAIIEGGDVGNFFAMIGDNIEFERFDNYTRSRPAPSPDTDRHDPRIELRKVIAQEEHDATIRNQTLDDVVSGIQGLNRTKPYLNSNDKFAMKGRMEVMSLVESLRTEAQK